jgi:hypothetical protein
MARASRLCIKISNPFSAQLWFSTGLLLGFALLITGFHHSAVAEPRRIKLLQAPKTSFEIDQSTTAQTQELLAGPVKAVINLEKVTENSMIEHPFSYQLFYNGLPKLSLRTTTSIVGTVQLMDLTNDQIPEVIVTTFSGGAHCCTEYTIHGWERNRFFTIKTGPLDSGGGLFKDLDGDRKVEFLTADNAFLYAFSSYAGSFPPTRIYQYRPGKLVNVTRNYPKVLRAHAWQMYQAIQDHDRSQIDINGVLAGYVAQKILLGEFQDGWNLMMARYDRKSDWGLERYQGDKVVGKYPNFPIALRAFLINTGYLDKQGLPVKHDS